MPSTSCESWWEVIIKPNQKPGKSKDAVKSYRPISLLSTLSKITERVILNRLNSNLNTNRILVNKQFGFRHKHSTTTLLGQLVDHITNGYNENKHTGMIVLDKEKAYDTVWHEGHLFKLSQYKFLPYIIKIIYAWLSKRKIIVQIRNEISNQREIRFRLPQRSAISPKLYIYINDMPRTTGICMYE